MDDILVDLEKAKSLADTYAFYSDERGLLSGYLKSMCDAVERLRCNTRHQALGAITIRNCARCLRPYPEWETRSASICTRCTQQSLLEEVYLAHARLAQRPAEGNSEQLCRCDICDTYRSLLLSR